MTRYKNLPSCSFVVKKRGRLWLWFPECLEPVCRSFSLQEIEGVRLCRENDTWCLYIQMKGKHQERVACFERKEGAEDALHKLSHALMKRTRSFFYKSIIVLAILGSGWILLILPSSSPEAETYPPSSELSSFPERPVFLPQKVYGIPRDASEFLREKQP